MLHLNYATVGTSISHGTLRSQDLIPEMLTELEFRTSNGSTRNANRETDEILNDCVELYNELVERYYDDNGDLRGDDDDVWTEYDIEDRCSLEDALNNFAPEYCYFGAHPGDGSDIGYWPNHDSIDELDTVDDINDAIEETIESIGPNEFPDVKVVNDHGNVSIYRPVITVEYKLVADFV